MKPGYFAAISIALGYFAFTVSAQQQGGFDPAESVRRALDEPFVGITIGGAPQTGLYEIRKTGVSTAPVLEAARHLLASMSDAQRGKIMFPVDDPEWRNWANIHRFPRKGVSLDEMNPKQRERAYELLHASLSAKGYKTSRDIMRLNHHLAELVSNFDDYGEHLYWFIVFGNPATSGPWGWQIEGHHLIINYFILGDQVVMTPTFMGSEPVSAASGKYAGVSVFQPEQDLGLEFMRSLPSDLQRAASIGAKGGRSDNVTEMFKDNVRVPFIGLAAERLSSAHRDKLIELIGLFIGNLRDGHAAVKLKEIRGHLDKTYFAWKGAIDAHAVFYYRIHSPVILIEFDHQGPIALDGPRQTPTRRHIHTVVRTPNGNDYGKDLLRQHHASFKNDAGHGHQTR